MDLQSVYHASNTDTSIPRIPVMQRVADRRAVGSVHRTLHQTGQQTQLTVQAQPAADDSRDPLLPINGIAEGGYTWTQVWKRLNNKRLPRTLRYFGWLLLHQALPVGGSWHYSYPADPEQVATAICSHPGCLEVPPPPRTHDNSNSRRRQRRDESQCPLETLQHLFFQCPTTVPVLHWLCSLWGRIEPGNAPPMTIPVLLADDQSTWQPNRINSSLWTYLRLAALRQIWVQRCYRKHQQRTVSAVSTIAAIVQFVRTDIKADWMRVVRDIKVSSGQCVTWFKGRDPSLTPTAFQNRWCRNNILAQCGPAVQGQLTMRLHLTTTSALS